MTAKDIVENGRESFEIERNRGVERSGRFSAQQRIEERFLPANAWKRVGDSMTLDGVKVIRRAAVLLNETFEQRRVRWAGQCRRVSIICRTRSHIDIVPLCHDMVEARVEVPVHRRELLVSSPELSECRIVAE